MKRFLARLLRRAGFPPERTVHAVVAGIKGLICRVLGSGFIGSPGVKSYGLFFITIDDVNELPSKHSLDLSSLSCRLDVTGLRGAGVKIASDVRALNRGNLVIGAGWTVAYNHRYTSPFDEATPADYRFQTHETIRLMFTADAEWRDTPEFHLFQSQLRQGMEPYGIKNFSQLEKRGEDLKRLYASIKSHGYKPSQEVGGHYWDEAHFYLNQYGKICVGRHGNHRMAIARLLGLGEIPAIFGGVHISQVDSNQSDFREVKRKIFRMLEDHPTVLKRSY